MDKDAFYFPHFCNARYDRKLRRVRKDLGIEGYAIYFMILEVLREQEEFAYPISDIDLLSDDFCTTEAKVEAVVKGYNLFEIRDDKFFYSPRFVEYLTPYLERKELNKINGIKGNLIRYKYATKEVLDKMSPEEILRLNENKGDLVGGDSGGDRKERKGKEINKGNKINSSSVTSGEGDVPNASDSDTWNKATSIAEYLIDSICTWDPTHRYNSNRPLMGSSIKEIDLALRRDGRTEKQLRFIIDYLFKEKNDVSDFWAPNIQSGKKLRDKFDELKNKIITLHNKKNGRTIRDYGKKLTEAEEFYDRFTGQSE